MTNERLGCNEGEPPEKVLRCLYFGPEERLLSLSGWLRYEENDRFAYSFVQRPTEDYQYRFMRTSGAANLTTDVVLVSASLDTEVMGGIVDRALGEMNVVGVVAQNELEVKKAEVMAGEDTGKRVRILRMFASQDGADENDARANLKEEVDTLYYLRLVLRRLT